MSQSELFDILVLGSGEGGKYLAWHMAQAGHRTAVIERRLIGGSCPTINCLPSKNEIWSAKVSELVRRAAEFGTMTGPRSVDMARVRQRKRDMVASLITLVQTAMLVGMPYTGLCDAIFTHPTMAEGLIFLCANVPPPAVR